MKTLVLVDTNNIGFMSMNDRYPIAAFLGRVVEYRNRFAGAEICYLNDGKSWRRDIYPEYKANRTVSEKQRDSREEYYIAKKQMILALELLGCRQVSSANMEADDLAAIMSAKWKGKVVLVSRDQDWNQLVNETVVRFCPYERTYLNDRNFSKVTGYRDTEQFIEAKCILGDAGDNIKGIKGIGPKALEGLYSQYSSLTAFLKEIDHNRDLQVESWQLRTGKIMPKALREIETTETRLRLKQNMALVDLHTPVRPLPLELKNQSTTLDSVKFLEFCYENSCTKITREYKSFIKQFEV